MMHFELISVHGMKCRPTLTFSRVVVSLSGTIWGQDALSPTGSLCTSSKLEAPSLRVSFWTLSCPSVSVSLHVKATLS